MKRTTIFGIFRRHLANNRTIPYDFRASGGISASNFPGIDIACPLLNNRKTNLSARRRDLS